MECERVSLERSGEEQDELQRSTKRVKEALINGGQSDASHALEDTRTKSYRDKLIGDFPGAHAQMCLDDRSHISDVESDNEMDEVTEGFAAVMLSKETKVRIRGAWSNALIVKVFGRTVGYHYLHRTAMNLWKPHCRVDCLDLGSDFFLFRFEAKDDLDKVLEGGPWFFGGHYVTVRLWEPNFKASTAKLNSIVVWVRLNELPVEYYDALVLREIGSAIGPVLKVDVNTATGTRGRYARLCIQIDVSKPLVKTVLIGSLAQEVVYEGIGSLCFGCGRIGHKREVCPYVVRNKVPEIETQQELDDPKTMREMGGGRKEEHDSTGKDEYGPWMVVSRRRAGPKRDFADSGNRTRSKQAGSSSLVRPAAYKEVHAGQNHHSNPRYDSNGKYDSNGHIVGPEESADKTMEVNVDVSPKSNTCLVEMAQECEGSNGPRPLLIGQVSDIGGNSDGPVGLSDGQEKGLTKHGRGKSGQSKKHKKVKALSVGIYQPKLKQASSRSFGGGNHGKTTNRNLGLARSDSKGSLEDYPYSSSGDPGAGVPIHGPASSPRGKEFCLEKLPGSFENVGLLRIKQPNGADRLEGSDFEGNEAGTVGSISREGSHGMELDVDGDDAAAH